MRKLMLFLAALLLAAITPAPPASADRTYTLCDPFASKFCRGLVALYEFEQDANSSRSSETGSALLTESVDTVARSATHRTGSYSADFLKAGTHPTLYLLDTVGFARTFTTNAWVRFDTNEWVMTSGLYESIAGMVTASAEGYPRLVLHNNGGTYEFR